jgi:hypothetical protein
MTLFAAQPAIKQGNVTVEKLVGNAICLYEGEINSKEVLEGSTWTISSLVQDFQGERSNGFQYSRGYSYYPTQEGVVHD